MKKAITLIVAICILMSIFLVVGCVEDKDDAKLVMNIDYITQKDGTKVKQYNGMAQEFFNVTEQEPQTVKITVQKISGELNIKIFKEDDESFVAYEGHVFPSTTFTVNVAEIGRYVILVACDDFIGEYKFEYDLSK